MSLPIDKIHELKAGDSLDAATNHERQNATRDCLIGLIRGENIRSFLNGSKTSLPDGVALACGGKGGSRGGGAAATEAAASLPFQVAATGRNLSIYPGSCMGVSPLVEQTDGPALPMTDSPIITVPEGVLFRVYIEAAVEAGFVADAVPPTIRLASETEWAAVIASSTLLPIPIARVREVAGALVVEQIRSNHINGALYFYVEPGVYQWAIW